MIHFAGNMHVLCRYSTQYSKIYIQLSQDSTSNPKCDINFKHKH